MTTPHQALPAPRSGQAQGGGDRSGSAETWVVGVLGGSPGGSNPSEYCRIADLLDRHRLGPLAYSEGTLPEPLRSRFEGPYLAAAVRNGLLREVAATALGALRSAGVPALLFKGLALLESGIYADPGARPMDDGDVLVPLERVSDAVRALEGAGFRPWRPWREATPEWSDSLPFGAQVQGVEVVLDLHWRTEYDRIRFGKGSSPLWTEAAEEGSLPRAEPHLVLLAEHLLKHLRWRIHLLGVADCVRLARCVRDWDEVVRVARARRHVKRLGVFLSALQTELGVPLPTGLGAALGCLPTDRPRAVIGSWVGRSAGAGSRWAGLLAHYRAAGSHSEGWTDLVEAALPDARWLRARYPSEGPIPALRVLHAWKSFRWLIGSGESPLDPGPS